MINDDDIPKILLCLLLIVCVPVVIYVVIAGLVALIKVLL